MSAKINDGGSAFPVHANHAVIDGRVVSVHETGMTLRDWFAGQALAGMGGQWEKIEEYLMDSTADRVREFIACATYRQADKMIAAREVKP